MQTIRNKYNIEVKVQCASCAFKEQTKAMSIRLCNFHKKKVCPQNCCDAWKMNHALEQLGAVKGTVKSREYLMFILKIRIEEQEREEKGEEVVPMPVEEIRKLFNS